MEEDDIIIYYSDWKRIDFQLQMLVVLKIELPYAT